MVEGSVKCTGCLRKKYSVTDYQYFKNGNIQQCNIFRLKKYNSYLVVCEVSTPYIKHNESYELEKNDGSIWTWTIKQQIYAQVYFHHQVTEVSPFDPFLLRS